MTDAVLAARLVAAQFPRWADLPITPLDYRGTDNTMFRLGDRLLLRLPSAAGPARDVGKEQRLLPRLAAHLPVRVPVPVAMGDPAFGYPWPWSVYEWIDAEPLTPACDSVAIARDLAGFVHALHAVELAGERAEGALHWYRCDPLARRDADTRTAIAACGAEDTLPIWTDALRDPQPTVAPVFVHADLRPSNLLERDGRLHAVIDFGGLAIGDPTIDLLPAWLVFAPAAREAYRAAIGVDDATWRRGRGWALSVVLVALAYYRDLDPVMTGECRVQLEQLRLG